MPIPSEHKLTAVLKNNINEVVRFLDQLHGNHYRVYNLCLERKYDYEKFKGRVSEYQFAHSTAPSLAAIVNFVNDAADWLDLHPRNVCVVHCSNGKGRTGTMVACLLLKIGVCSTSSEALQLFANRRTVDGKIVVKYPSQLRYVSLYDQYQKGTLLFGDHSVDPGPIDILKIDGRGIGDASIEKNIPRIITGIRLSSAPHFRRKGGCDPWFSIDQKGKRIFFSPPLKGVKSTESVYFSALRIIVEGDIRLDFYHKNFKTKMFSCALHTAAFRASAISLPKRELDLAWKDKSNKHFPANFKLEIFLAAAPDFDETADNSINEQGAVGSNQDTEEAPQERARLDSGTVTENSGANSGVNSGVFHGALTRMRASAQLETVSVIGSRCARCREVLSAQDFYLEVSGMSIHWDCLQCNDCGRVFGEGGKTNSCVLMREGGGVDCVRCGDFRNFFPACARCGDPVTSDEDCCVSVPAATTYWHSACFSCVRCNAALLFSDEDALWRIDPTTGMPVCFYHPSASPLTLPATTAEEDLQQLPIPPPPSPASGFFGQQPQIQNKDNEYQTIPQSPSQPLSTAQRTQSHTFLTQPIQSQIPQVAPQSPQHRISPLTIQHSHNQAHQNASSPHQAGSHPQYLPSSPPTDTQSPKATVREATLRDQASPPEHAASMSIARNIAARQCPGCGIEVVEGQEVLSAGGAFWHHGCLVCTHCHTAFSSSDRVIAVNGKLYCKGDFEKLFGLPCGKCHSIIEPGAGYFKAGAKQYHTACLLCAICAKQLSNTAFFVRNDLLLCEQHKDHSTPTSTRSAPLPSSTQQPPTKGDTGEAICHAVAALIKTVKDVLLTSENFDKKEFVALAKHLAMTGKEYSSLRGTNNHLDPILVESFNEAHTKLLLFCTSQLKSSHPLHSVLPTCESLENSRLFMLKCTATDNK